MRRREPFDGIQGWTNWTITVAWHEVQAEWRRQAKVEIGELPERPDMADPAVLVEYRLDLAAVANGLSRLKPSDRAATLAALQMGMDPSDPLAPSEKMRRYRARRRLAALIGGEQPQPAPPLRPTKPRERPLPHKTGRS